MRTLTKRLTGASALALALTLGVGVGVTPATAATASAASMAVVTVKGHVRDEAGKPLKGVYVASGCACDFETGKAPAYTSGSDRSSATGFYSFKVQKRYATTISFIPKGDAYLPSAPEDLRITKKSDGYVIDAKLQPTGEIAGTVLDDAGAPVSGAAVEVFDATTGKSVRGGNATRSTGRFHLKVAAGTYKLRIVAGGFYYVPEWYGDAPTKALSPAVTVAAGGKVAGINSTITRKQSIAGAITVDGADPIPFTKESFIVTLIDANGVEIKSMQTVNSYGFSDILPGTYTVRYTPSSKGAAFFTPVTQSVVVGAGQAVRKQDVDLASIPPVAGEKRGTMFSIQYQDSEVTAGEVFRTTAQVSSYGSVAGGKLSLYVDGKKVSTKTLPASGKATFASRLSTVDAGTVKLRLKYTGTDTSAAKTQSVGTIILRK